MDMLSKTNLMATMIILKHVKGTKNFNVKYEVENDVMLIGYLDSNWTGYQNDKKIHQEMFLAWKIRLYHCLLRSKRQLHYLHMKSSIFILQVLRVKLFG